MIYSENLTNRELLRNAMPLTGLSRKQWHKILSFAEDLQCSGTDSDLSEIIHTLIGNQSKIEMMEQFNFYSYDILNCPVREEKAEELILL